MRKNKNPRPEDPDIDAAERKQTDLAEGERETVEESIRIHEAKGDEQGKPAGKPAVKHGGQTS